MLLSLALSLSRSLARVFTTHITRTHWNEPFSQLPHVLFAPLGNIVAKYRIRTEQSLKAHRHGISGASPWSWKTYRKRGRLRRPKENGHSEMKNFKEEKNVTGGGGIQPKDILAPRKKKKKQGAYVRRVGCLFERCNALFCCKLPSPQRSLFMSYSQLFQISPGLRLSH